MSIRGNAWRRTWTGRSGRWMSSPSLKRRWRAMVCHRICAVTTGRSSSPTDLGLAARQECEDDLITPGSLWENAYIESFHDKLRDECLNREMSGSLQEARVVIEQWQNSTNELSSNWGHVTPFSVKRNARYLSKDARKPKTGVVIVICRIIILTCRDYASERGQEIGTCCGFFWDV